ncbi:hypothetical protein C6W92_06040 [Roseovarius sp. A46]|uniref:hypothetical protein n=1 Tax=Roseovarius sp. A46 TaxID=2109331 RepID=UPI001011AE5C|nr:hypothetical protein [Roseovarius sp. A46]RXV64858.1 hypothetical protein C6W92_06040 [Roseovarius sp. A46]
MADDTERLFVQLEGRISDFEKKMKQAERRGTRTYNKLQRDSRSATRRMERDMSRASGRINLAMASTSTAIGTVSRAMRLFTPLLATAGFAGFSSGVRSAVSELSALGKSARDVSVDVEFLQAVQRGFARSANVSQQEVTASLERFNRRVGEAANETGELNRFVERYGIQLHDANGELRTQEELLRDVADVIRRASSDQERAAIAQAAFGDTGRRLASTLARGADEIDRMVRAAEDAGQVIDRDLIDRAEELDDRFDDLTRTLSAGLKRIAVDSADAFEPVLDAARDLMDQRSDLSDIFGSDEAARGLLGDDLFNRLSGNLSLIGESLRELRDLSGAVDGIEGQTRGALEAFSNLLRQLRATGETEAAAEMRQIAIDIASASSEFKNGEISAADFSQRLVDLDRRADEAVEGIDGLDRSSLDGIKSQFGGLISLVELLVARVRDVKNEASETPERRPQDIENERRAQGAARAQAEREAAQAFIEEQERRRNLTVEQIAVEQEAARLRREAANEDVQLTEDQINAQARLNVARRAEMRGGSSGGGVARTDDFSRAVEAIRERTAELEAEAAALVLAANSGREYGSAIDFAMQRARLLNAAQRAGLEITPELEAAVDSLADAYTRSADQASAAADRMRETEIASERGAAALSQMFGGILNGASDAKDAMGQLLQRIAQVQLEAAITGLSKAGGIGKVIGGLLGFSEGGFTGPGDKDQPAGVVHAGEFVFSKKATQAIGVGRLQAMHSAAKGFANGGLVGPAPQCEAGPETIMERKSDERSYSGGKAPRIRVAGG